MKNKHLLLLTAAIAFLTYYVPVVFFSDYVNHIPLWVLPMFWIVARIPFWFNETVWKTSKIGSETYNMFHQLHYDGKEWGNKKANVWLVVSKFFKWWVKQPICLLGTTITIAALFYGLWDMYNDVMHPFVPYYVMVSLWWVYFTMSFFEFKEKVKYGYVSYGQRRKSTTHFSKEWYDEQDRLNRANKERKVKQ